MHLVNEDLLEHNLKAESGIQRLWEDGSLDIRLRDMRISEVGLMLPQKCQQIAAQYLESTKCGLESEPLAIEEGKLVHSALLMLQGVPSFAFRL